MEGSPGDLQTKYHKLAGEYSKLRAQSVVLKKAVVDEQTLNSELKESLREAEQSLRKADQELDSLNFRNEQLTRRVTVLQDELDTLQNQSKNKKSKLKPQDGQHPTDFTNHVIDEEFRKKIQENARLLSLMNEKEDQHRQELTNVTSQLDQVSFELSQLRKNSSDMEQKSKSVVAKLERELSCMREGQQQLADVTRELAQLRQSHADYKNKMEAKVATLSAVISSHLPFIDSKNETLNSLNVPRVMETKGSLSSSLGEDLRAALQQMAASLALWHKVSEARLLTLPTATSTANSKFAVHLKESGELALELERYLSPSKMCKTTAQRLPGQFASYCSHVETMLVHQRLSVEEEEEIDPTDESLRESNRVYLANCSQLVSHLVQVNSRLTLYRSMQHSSESQQKHQRGLISLCSQLQDSFKDLFNAFVVKSGIETERSWSTEELNSANQSVTNSLSSLMESSAKITKCLRELWKMADTMAPSHPLVSDLRRKGVHYINAIHTDEAPTISYSQALRDHEEAQNSTKVRETLLRQLDDNKEQLVRAEQDREQWKQELQLLQLRYQKEKEEIIKNDEFTSLVNSTVTNMIGSLEVPVNLPQEVEAREEAVKQYFRQRINNLIAENGDLQSKSAALLAETAALVRRLEASVADGMRLEEALHEARERAAQLQEEVTTTATNYEAQLSTMSEHLLNMNERLAQQKDTIDQLQYQIANKKGKK
ncbi:protein phosphatase 1 regulatory subunit 21 isoform X2 [Homalodisca vitripennis]|uniref:protein phosphatase 1 regulatory subunit 21 isoform X2 n=1 Tax=Homalodisca vitripennis TaxID=197043 RepID=UPI001EEB7DED|nr:protein phosphatase 1 regulatory subunit 21 isoform X2 [Homalodisca vitripennis]